MSRSRRIRKIIYSTTIVVSFIAGTLTGHTAKELPTEFYAEPYAGQIFIGQTGQGAEKFTDISGTDWFYGYVDALTQKGIISGRSETEYAPSGTLTVPECAAIVVRCLGLEDMAMSEQARLGMPEWYAGYMKVCIDAGIIEPDMYGFGYDENGGFVKKSENGISEPVKRYELAAFLSRLTMLDGTEIKARNTYFERGGNGHEFIRGGMYDKEAVALYADEIADFEDIPEQYRLSVLRCYYNALFNGDTNGNFNPENSLTRAEMAKLAAALTDISLRFGNDYREDAYSPTESDFRKNAAGEKVLKKQSGYDILRESAEKLEFVGNGYLRVPLYAVWPLGYTAEVYVYIGNENGYTQVCKISPETRGSYGNGTFIDCGILGAPGVKVLYILRNTATGGEVEGVLEANISGGVITLGDGISRM